MNYYPIQVEKARVGDKKFGFARCSFHDDEFFRDYDVFHIIYTNNGYQRNVLVICEYCLNRLNLAVGEEKRKKREEYE